MSIVPTFLVAVDFSEGSNRAVEYAVALARIMPRKVELVHAADPDELGESHNQIAVLRSINRITEKARTKLRSYQELIFEKWQVAVSYDVRIGRVSDVLSAAIERSRPDLVFLGKNGNNSRQLRSLLREISTPVMVIPAETTVRAPKHLIVATDLKPLRAESVTPVLNLHDNSNPLLKLLYVSKVNGKNGVNVDKITEKFNRQLKVHTELVYRSDETTLSGVQQYLATNATDVVCAVRRPKGFLRSLFSDGTSIQLAMQAPVPTLIVTERGS